ncbi:hypothetical protein [Sporosarcina highlanderae]|uniref:Uncharacterized protein n=1 Tax=Sporosarcina highlanderae TaxID=3035916 RepID=A0ABT8JWC5_9BACL|nr:hypothetical protein [Sporosarcina highlanderae]MDN4608642.1 hypothetical protein [Sporosarcina highlanderae]
MLTRQDKAIQRHYADKLKRQQRAKLESEAAERAAQLRAAENQATAEEIERQLRADREQKRAQLAEAEAAARKLGTVQSRVEYAKLKRELDFYNE